VSSRRREWFSGFAESLDGLIGEELVSLSKDGWDALGKGAVPQGMKNFYFVEGGCIFAREPVGAVAKEVVAHFGKLDHVEGGGVGPETQNFPDVDFAGDLVEFRDALGPVGDPVFAVVVDEGVVEALFNGGDEPVGLGKVLKGFDMGVEVARPGGPEAECMDFWSKQAEKVIECHRSEGLAELDEFFWWRVELAAFVIGADDEDSDVLA